MKSKHNEGFTLVELLVSIVILAAIVIPTCTSLVMGYRLNAKAKQMMQAQLAVSSAVETLMAEGIHTQRAEILLEKNAGIYDYAWETDKVSEIDDYPKVQITIEKVDGVDTYYNVTVTDDASLMTVKTQIRAKGGA